MGVCTLQRTGTVDLDPGPVWSPYRRWSVGIHCPGLPDKQAV